MTQRSQAIGNPLETFKANMGKLGGGQKPQPVADDKEIYSRNTDIQKSSEEDEKPDRKEAVQTRKSVGGRMKTGYSLDRKLIKQTKRLAVEEEVDVNDLIEEGLRLVFAARKHS